VFENYVERIHETRPKEEELNPGYMAVRRGDKWHEVRDPSQWVEERTGIPGLDQKVTLRFIGKPAAPPPASGGAAADGSAPTNITEAEYARLKRGEKYWWNGKQFTKQ